MSHLEDRWGIEAASISYSSIHGTLVKPHRSAQNITRRRRFCVSTAGARKERIHHFGR